MSEADPGEPGLVKPIRAPRRAISQREFNRLIITVLSIGLVILAGLGASIFWLSFKTREYNYWVDHTHIVEQRVQSFMASVERMETARRGYLLAPTENQLNTYADARRAVAVSLYTLAQNTQDNPVQAANVAHIRPALTWKIKANEDSINQIRTGQVKAAQEAFADEQTLQPLVGIRVDAEKMMDEERRLLVIRTAQEEDALRVLTLVGVATAILLALLSISALMIVRQFAEDLTAAQADLRDLNQALEQRVEQRTAGLMRANEEIQRFAYIVSHDLRSPLVNVMGFTSELELAMKPLRALVRWIEERDLEKRLPEEVKRAVDSEIPEAIDFIRASTRKMDGLIGAILKLSREGRRVLHPEPLAMEALVETMFDTVRHRLDEAGGEAVIEGRLPDIVSDRLAIEQVLGNLIDNAVKYRSAKRTLRIAVRAHTSLQEVVFEVQDNGRGIDPKDHERIFELFRRSGVQSQTGEGIGLAHVRALVYRLGGLIDCSSALDEGALFRITLPLVLSHTEGTIA